MTMTSRRSKLTAGRVITYVFLIIGALFMVLPFLWMITTSLKTIAESIKVPIVWLPKTPQWSNFSLLMTKYHFGVFIVNTVIVTIAITAFQVITCAMSGYAFARLNFPCKNVIFVICLMVEMIPSHMIVIPRFLQANALGWLDNFAGLIIPQLPSIFGTFLLRQAFMSLPRDLEESAKLDGCGFFGVFWKIMLPLVTNSLIAFGVLTVLWSWNELLWPLIVISKQSMYVLSIGIANLQGQYSTRLNLQAVAGILAFLPMLVVYLLAQKNMAQGIATTGIKG